MAQYEVIVGNIGSVYYGTSFPNAARTYQDYEDLSKEGYGRAANEQVTLLEDGIILKEYVPNENSEG